MADWCVRRWCKAKVTRSGLWGGGRRRGERVRTVGMGKGFLVGYGVGEGLEGDVFEGPV